MNKHKSIYIQTCSGGLAGVMVRPLAVKALSSLNSGGRDRLKFKT